MGGRQHHTDGTRDGVSRRAALQLGGAAAASAAALVLAPGTATAAPLASSARRPECIADLVGA